MPDKETSDSAPFLLVWKWKLHWQILLGLLVGASVGVAFGMWAVATAGEIQTPDSLIQSNWFLMVFKLLGDLFLNGLKMIVVPLVSSSIVLAVSNIGSSSSFGRMGLKTLAYYLSTSVIAILIGLTLVNIMAPGRSSEQPLLSPSKVDQLQDDFSSERDRLESSAKKAEADRPVFEKVLNVFRRMVPSNIIQAAAEGNLLAMIFVALLVGYFTTHLPGNIRPVMINFWKGVYHISMKITDLVLAFAPIGVACLLMGTLSENYAKLSAGDRFGDLLSSVIWFSVTASIALAIHFFVVLPLLVFFFTGRNPILHFKAMGPALMTAFSTSSSNATLPVSIECLEERAGVSEKTASFVLPLGATINMDGTALYECVAAIFIAQLFGADLSMAQQFFVVVVALLTSVGVAGVPSASLVAIMIILQSLSNELGPQYPLEKGLPILLVFDRLLDMLRTSVNVFSDSCGAVIIASSEGEKGLYPDLANAD